MKTKRTGHVQSFMGSFNSIEEAEKSINFLLNLYRSAGYKVEKTDYEMEKYRNEYRIQLGENLFLILNIQSWKDDHHDMIQVIYKEEQK